MKGLGPLLADSQLAQLLRDTSWAIPAVQCVHIAAIAVLFVSSLVGQLRLAGLMATDVEPAPIGRWLAPRVRWPFAALLITGSLMIISEPERTLTNSVFWVKMGLVVCALALSELLFRAAAKPGEASQVARIGALTVLVLWLGAIVCGRWIAYLY